MDVQLEQAAARPAARQWRPGRALLVPALVAAGWLVLAVLVPGPALAGWAVGEAARVLLLLGVMLGLWVLPGLALLGLLAPVGALGWGSRLAMALGCGIALPPLLLSFSALVGLRWGRLAIVAYIAAAFVLVALRFRILFFGPSSPSPFFRRKRQDKGSEGRFPSPVRPGKGVRGEGLFLNPQFFILTSVVLLGLGFVLRMYVMRDLPTGLWGDSYHHTMIAQLLAENGGLFSSWEPYAPLTTFTYHFGFHVNVAFFHWLTGVSVPRSLLYTGQLLNWATLPAAYLLTRQLTRSRWAAVLAVLLTGFVNQQPLFYINWGRYTQLAGQAMLPALLMAWIWVMEPGFSRAAPATARPAGGVRGMGPILLAALLTASLMLTHYLVTLFAALLVATYLVLLYAVRWPAWTAYTRADAGAEGSTSLPDRPGASVGPTALRIAGRVVLAAGLAVLLAAPWLVNTLGGYLVRNVGGSSGDNGGAPAAPPALPPIDAGTVLPLLLALALLGAVFALARREWRAGVLAVWALLLIAVTQPYLLGLPGTGVVSTLAAYITLYLPLLPLAAYALATPLEALARRNGKLATAIATVAVVGLSVWGLRWQQHVVDPYFQHVRPADARAMEWIRDNTEPEARFLVNMLPAYGSLMVGTDGGWWIPLLAGRQTTLPPVTYGSERSSIPQYSKQVREFSIAIRNSPPASPEGMQLLREAGIAYVYTGSHEAPRTDDVIDVEALRASPEYELVYDQDGVAIFRMRAE